VLVHLALGAVPPGHVVVGARADEGAVLAGAACVIATSEWSRQQLHSLYALPADRVFVARPGADPADRAAGTPPGGELLCVAAVTQHKGHDILLEALTAVADVPWRLTCVGSLEREPAFVEKLQAGVADLAWSGRVVFRGARTGPDLDAAYAA